MTLPKKARDFGIFLGLYAVVAVCGLIASGGWGLNYPSVSATTPLPATPLGYTRSLILFLLPCVVFSVWLGRYLEAPLRQRAFFYTIGCLFPVGAGLDVFLAKTFFTFENREANLSSYSEKLLLPAFDIHSGLSGLSGAGWSRYIPVEEFVFYGAGFAATLLFYMWADEVLFKNDKIDFGRTTPGIFYRWWSTISLWIGIGVLLSIAAFWLAHQHSSAEIRRYPGYMLFLIFFATVPSLLLCRLSFRFVNWRALTVCWLFIQLVSVFWESALAIPFGWWGYQPKQMMGVYLNAPCLIPLEALLVWSLGPWMTALLYEFILTLLLIQQNRADGGSTLRVVKSLMDGNQTEVNKIKQLHILPNGKTPPHNESRVAPKN